MFGAETTGVVTKVAARVTTGQDVGVMMKAEAVIGSPRRATECVSTTGESHVAVWGRELLFAETAFNFASGARMIGILLFFSLVDTRMIVVTRFVGILESDLIIHQCWTELGCSGTAETFTKERRHDAWALAGRSEANEI